MGLLEGKKALIFGVANDHSIAWGIARAFHEQGATVGFSSIESLIERRVQPLADSIGATFVEACDVQDDAHIAQVFERWREVHGELDILVHALAFARREDPTAPSSIPLGRASRWPSMSAPTRSSP
jgi:enoyl-[acyl-carrier protein] reductase I